MVADLAAWSATLLMRLTGPDLALPAHAPHAGPANAAVVCKGALNAADHYGAPKYAGAVFNMVMIATPLLLAYRLGVVSLAVGHPSAPWGNYSCSCCFLPATGYAYAFMSMYGQWSTWLTELFLAL